MRRVGRALGRRAQGFDYVIVGGGSAGCVLAARLSENPAARVCLIEAGRRDTNPLIHLPIGFSKMSTAAVSWGLVTAPQTNANNRTMPYTQAKVLGGGSSINAQVFTRGHPSDYDRWAEDEGATGWGFEDVRRYFLRSEGNTVLSGDWHGTDGPLGVSQLARPNQTTQAFVQSCVELGMPFNPDFNGPVQEGAGPYQTTMRNRRRCSTAVGYLRPALSRPNLTLITGAMVLRILFEGKRAVGIEYARKGEVFQARADAEVVVTSGAIGSPKLMMLSGVGPAAHLRAHGIGVVQDLPGVGQNLTDHLAVNIVAELKGHESLNKYKKAHWAALAGMQYLLFRAGPVASNVVEGGAFWYANGPGSAPCPDLQFHFLCGAGTEAGVPTVVNGASGITLNSYYLRPKSRGSVTLRSADPADLPIVDPNFLAEPEDLRISAQGVQLSREIFSQPALQKMVTVIRSPDKAVRSQADFEDYVRQFGRTAYHPTSTCRMGSDEMAVLDPSLRVRGLDGIRICDASVMPSLIGSNTNAVAIMIAEKAADLIRGNH